ncbi:MAG: HAMP domain-containing protein [Betaproteobacteria bacterium]|nr:HAMP domain-containing protein [Betaproteobacteria bacterium]
MSLFARSFLLIALLILSAAAATYQLYRIYEREPRARELAQQTVSIVNLTRAALVNADPVLRRDLLIELNAREGIRLAPLTGSEALEPLPDDPLFELVAARIRQALGAQTRFAFARDRVEGFWVSFTIDEDDYWVMLPRERFQPAFGAELLGWALALLGLALAGAWLIASTLSRPLGAIAAAARAVGRGQAPAPLEERGPTEMRTVSVAFNRMAGDLAAMERERAMVLAGISHDLRTPLSRLRLALEMSGADRAAAEGMSADVEEIDKVIGQFLDFARGDDEPRAEGDLDGLIAEIAEGYRRRSLEVSWRGHAPGRIKFSPMAVRRALANLVDNALHYAGAPVEIALRSDGKRVLLEVMDRGPGVPPEEAERLKRPFARLDEARSGRGGAGLGLAIVERVARAHGGGLELLSREGGGLVARLSLAA